MSELQRAIGVFLIVCISAPANVEQVTHIGTTTTIGNVSVFSPSSEAALGTPLPCSGTALPVATAPPFTQVTNVMTRTSIPAAPVASLQLPTAAGLVHGQIGIQIGTVRRIR